MKKMILYFNLVLACIVLVGCFGIPAWAEEDLRYSCSAQVYEAFENSRLNLFIAQTGIPVDSFVASSNSCIYRVMQDMTDVASTTRPISKRYRDYGLMDIPFCKDPLAVIVNKNMAIQKLSTLELRLLFSGDVANWKELGGPDLPVTLVVPEKDTGAYKNFRNQVMKHKEIHYDYMTYTSTRVLEAVETLPLGAVSFISKGAQFSHPKVKVLTINGKKPEDKNYPFYQVFYLISKGAPAGSVKTFIDFALSDVGREIITKRGMLPLN